MNHRKRGRRQFDVITAGIMPAAVRNAEVIQIGAPARKTGSRAAGRAKAQAHRAHAFPSIEPLKSGGGPCRKAAPRGEGRESGLMSTIEKGSKTAACARQGGLKGGGLVQLESFRASSRCI